MLEKKKLKLSSLDNFKKQIKTSHTYDDSNSNNKEILSNSNFSSLISSDLINESNLTPQINLDKNINLNIEINGFSKDSHDVFYNSQSTPIPKPQNPITLKFF